MDENEKNQNNEESRSTLVITDRNSKPMLQELLLDRIIEKTTFSRHRLFIFLCMIFIFIADGIEMFLFGLIIIPFKKYFSLEEGPLLEFTSSTLFLGIALGSLLVSYLSDKLSRVTIVLSSSLLLTISHLIMTIFLHLIVFIVCRTLIGLSLGILMPIFINIYGEYLPSKYRGFLLMFAWSFFGVGMMIMNTTALFIMPELEEEQLQNLFIILLTFPSLATTSCFFLLSDGPRNILLINDPKKNCIAFDILNYINGKKLTKEEEIQLIEELNITKKNITDGKGVNIFKEMFSSYFKRTTILMILILFSLSYIGFGISSVSSLVLDHLNEESEQKEEKSNKNIIINQLMISVGEFSADIIGGFIGEIKCLGRKGAIIIFAILAMILYAPAPYYQVLFEFMTPVGSGCTSIYINIILDYVVELYPTRIRDKSTSLLYMVFRMSGFATQFMSIGFFQIVYFLPYVVYLIFALLIIIFTALLPYEVAGKSLDKTYNN